MSLWQRIKIKEVSCYPRRVPPAQSKVVEPEIDRLFREKYNEIVQDTGHFPPDLVQLIVKNRMKKWYESLIEKGRHDAGNTTSAK